jgi:hypothetical protein
MGQAASAGTPSALLAARARCEGLLQVLHLHHARDARGVGGDPQGAAGEFPVVPVLEVPLPLPVSEHLDPLGGGGAPAGRALAADPTGACGRHLGEALGVLLQEEADGLVLTDEICGQGVAPGDRVEGEGGQPLQPGVGLEVFPAQERADGGPAELGGVPGVAPREEHVQGVGLHGHHLAHPQ